MSNVTHDVIDAGIMTLGPQPIWWVNSGRRAGEPGGPVAAGDPGGPPPPNPGNGGGQPAPGGGNPGEGDAGGAPSAPANNSSVGGPVTRQEILDRARHWSNQGVPYSMQAYTNDANGKSYRTDCSGLVSMALHLPNSESTVTLPGAVHPINKDDLKPGDIVGNLGPGTAGAGGHVMIFNGWVDESRTQFRTIEETPPRAVEKVQTWGSAPYTSSAWRYNNLVDP